MKERRGRQKLRKEKGRLALMEKPFDTQTAGDKQIEFAKTVFKVQEKWLWICGMDQSV